MKTIIVTALIVILGACSSVSEPAQSKDSLLGLWVWKTEAPEDTLSLTIENNDGDWNARIQSAEVPITVDGNKVQVTGGEGRTFIGEFSDNKSSIIGYWHQPASQYSYSRMVTRAVLQEEAAGQWAAQISAQPRPFHIFLDIFESDDGAPMAVIRNPERNEIMRSFQFKLEPNKAGSWSLVTGEEEYQRRHDLTQTNETTLELDHNWFDKTLSLRPATDIDARYYYSRAVEAPSRYSQPLKEDDGWVIATPAEAGLNRAALDAMVAEISTANPQSPRPRLIHSLLVAHKGRLVVEEYFHGHDGETRHDTRSLAKVFGPVLIGALREEGYMISPDDRPIEGILKAAGDPIDDPRKKDITLGHLMSFASGLDCNTASSTSPGSEDNMWEQRAETDFWRYTSRLPMLYEPGQRYAYCSGSINLVGASLQAAANMPIYEAFDRFIAQPLEFGPYHWNLAPNGAGYLGGGVYMRPRDILKVGAMYAADGVWNDRQIVSADWTVESTTPKIDISPETTGLSQDDFANNYFGGQHAYIWRNDTVIVGERSYDSYEATGNGGQILVVVPELDLAVVLTGGNYRAGSIWGRWRQEIVGGHIIPAMAVLEIP